MKKCNSSIADPTKREFDIKLLAGKNVVLVESKNYESEIFVPTIQDGRISFQNIIPNRRCCHASLRNLDAFRTSIQSHGELPIANSTPLLPKQHNKDNIRFHSKAEAASASNICDCPSPEPARRQRSLQNLSLHSPVTKHSKTSVKTSQGMKVLKLYRKHTQGTPQNAGRLVGGQSSNSSRGDLLGEGIRYNQSSYCLPNTPSPRHRYSFIRPTLSSIQKQNLKSAESPKWRPKVLTPKRTYSRRPEAASVLANVIIQCLKSAKNAKQHPQPTKAPNTSHKAEVQKRHLIVDKKLSTSPQSYKKYQLDTNEESRKNTSFIRKSLPRTRSQLDRLKATAFDLLTNSSRTRHMSHKLKNQFRAGCINKASSTYPKYKVISNVPALRSESDMACKPVSVVVRKSGGGDLKLSNTVSVPPMPSSPSALPASFLREAGPKGKSIETVALHSPRSAINKPQWKPQTLTTAKSLN